MEYRSSISVITSGFDPEKRRATRLVGTNGPLVKWLTRYSFTVEALSSILARTTKEKSLG